MYKNLLFLFACFFTITAVGQTTVNRKIALRYDKYANNAWQGQDSLVFQYNAFGKEWTRLSRRISAATTWDNFYRTTSTFDGTGNEVTYYRENWINGSWLNSTKYIYTYNSNNQKTDILYQTWNPGANAWGNTGRIVNTYNGNNLLTKLETFSWNGSSWLPTTRQDLGYNGANQLVLKENYTIVNSNYQGTFKYEYQYAFGEVSKLVESRFDASNAGWYGYKQTVNLINGSATPPNLAQSTISYNDTAGNNWYFDVRSFYTYNTNLLSTVASQVYDTASSVWKNSALLTNTYNANNQLSEARDQVYNSTTANYDNNKRREYTYNGSNLNNKITHSVGAGPAGWAESARDLYSYNNNDSLIHSLNENYVSNTYQPNEQYLFYFTDVPVGLTDVNNLFTEATLYPNPATETINIKTDEKINGAFVASIYTLDGKKRWSQMNSSVSSALQFTIADLAVGNYILQISEVASGKVQQFKFTKS